MALRAGCAGVHTGARESVAQLLLAKRDVARIDRVARVGGRQSIKDGQSLPCLLDRRRRLAGDVRGKNDTTGVALVEVYNLQ